MLYVHKLADLNPHSAEIESVSFIRNIRQGTTLPVEQRKIEQDVAGCLVSEDDIAAIEQSIRLIPLTIERLKAMLALSDPMHEPVNAHRTVQQLIRLCAALENNAIYGKELFSWQKELPAQIANAVNAIPNLRGREEMASANNALKGLFAKILRSQELQFNYADMVNEAHQDIANSLSESMEKGYLFHVTLEEEIRKLDFSAIKSRIPKEKLAEAEEIRQMILEIKRGVEAAYSVNMRMVLLAVVLFSYIRWASYKNR